MAGVRKTVAVPAGSLSGLLLYTLQQFDRIDFTIRLECTEHSINCNMSNSYKCAHFYTPFGVVRWMCYLALPLGELAAKPTERGLALPLGEVAEHSEDGEGNL